MRYLISITLFISIFLGPEHASAGGLFSLPTANTMKAIGNIAAEKEAPLGQPVDLGTIKMLKIDKGKIPADLTASLPADAQGKTSIPFVAANSIVLQFQPNLSEEQIEDYLKSNDLKVIKTYPSIAAIQVQTDLSKFFHAEHSDKSPNDAVLRGVVEASGSFKKDPRIREAAPDIYLQGQVYVANLSTPSDVTTAPLPAKMIDWGVKDVQADRLWGLPGANDGAIFGIMDVGFARHEDLVFIGLPSNTPIEDHGTHVAGIACGSHTLPRGIEGVLPNCFIRAEFGDVFFQSGIGDPISRFMTHFSQILGTLDSFTRDFSDVNTFNLSLGYNWEENFQVNPDAKDSENYRAVVEMQGSMIVNLLQVLEKQDKIIFSAAGNDSTGLYPPINAKYASPFNWAASTARANGIKSAVIVEAHDKNGQRAQFSNVGGDISCPGVDILSTIAFGPDGHVSNQLYGKMSGTSMASPYCAAGLALFRLVRPNYTGEQAVECLLKSHSKSSSGTTMLKLQDAVVACP